MLARPYDSRDARGCDLILARAHPGEGITDPARDEIYVVGNVGAPDGVLVLRECAYVHEFEVGVSGVRRSRADALANYAVAASRTKGLKSAVFLVRAGNLAMQRWVESIGAVKQSEDGDALYLLTPP